jgi:hypothetical protein
MAKVWERKGVTPGAEEKPRPAAELSKPGESAADRYAGIHPTSLPHLQLGHKVQDISRGFECDKSSLTTELTWGETAYAQL